MVDNPSSDRMLRHIYGQDAQGQPQASSLDAFGSQDTDWQVSRVSGAPVDIPTLQLYDTSINLVRTFDQGSPVAQVYRSNQDSLVRIKTIDRQLPNGDRVTSDGTGFFVKRDGTLATDYHVVKDARGGITVQTTDGRVYNAVITAIDTKHDLALLQVQKNNRYEVLDFQTASLASTSRSLGKNENIDAMGFPLSSDLLHISPGSYTTSKSLADFNLTGGLLPGEDPNRRIFTSEMNVQRGNSGGPILRESDGFVVGVVGMSNKDGTLAIGTPVEDLQALLNSTRAIQSPASGSAIASLLQPGVMTNFNSIPAPAGQPYYSLSSMSRFQAGTLAVSPDAPAATGSAIARFATLPSVFSQSRYNAPPVRITRKLGS